MSERLLSVEVQGQHKHWSFNFYGDPKFIPEWEADGLVISEVLNSIPVWWINLWPAWFPAVRVWCFCQDVFHFKNPWSGR